jgi:transposase InsO family protein
MKAGCFWAVVIDLFSRRVVGWSLQPHMQRSIVIDALEMACKQRRPDKDKLLFHSDRGSQYASEDFTRVLDHYGIMASMSRKGNCWDNACSETLFGSLKVEPFMVCASPRSERPRMQYSHGCVGTTAAACTRP